MSATVIDRRKSGAKKSSGIRQKFIKRVKTHVKEAVKKAIKEKNIADINEEDENNEVKVPIDGISEPRMHHRSGSDRKYVLSGNKDKIVGDALPKPEGGQGAGREGSPDGVTEDEFTFVLTKEEFLDFFFEDLALPDLIKTTLKDTNIFKPKRAGYTTVGSPVNMNIVRSMRNAIGRQMALQTPYIEELARLEKKLLKCKSEKERKEIEDSIEEAKKAIASVPFIDDIDIRYNSFNSQPDPATKAAMFCLMDVSASMGEWEKGLAKRFFMLLYVFLLRNYEKIDIIFIRHTHEAAEVDEQEFFYSTESGGTIVSTALTLMQEIIETKYSTSEWNIYGAQVSDGDNYANDSVVCEKILGESILPAVQYFAYVEIDNDSYNKYMWGMIESITTLWKSYMKLKEQFSNFNIVSIQHPREIFPVFQKLFKKKA